MNNHFLNFIITNVANIKTEKTDKPIINLLLFGF